MITHSSNDNKKNIWVNLFFVILIFLPVNNIGYLIQFFITGIIIIKHRTNRNVDLKLNIAKLGIVLCLSITFVYAVLNGKVIHSDSSIKIVYFIIIILFFPLIDNYKIRPNVLIGCVLFVILTQVSYVFQITFIINLIDTYYNFNETLYSSEITALNNSSSGLFSSRFGGIFRNPNQCGRIITLLYATYLVNIIEVKKKDILFICLVFLSVLLTGSRTALAIILFLTFVYFYRNFAVNKFKVVFSSIILVIFVSSFIDFESRIFDFRELSGAKETGSIGSKSKFLSDYIDYKLNTESADLLFGTFNFADELDYNFNISERIENFDSEIGYTLHAFGIFGILSILLFYFYVFKYGQFKVRFLMILLLWALSSSVLSNLRFSFLFFLVLSLSFPRKYNRKS